MTTNLPNYLELYESGELKERADALEERLASCDICPHNCKVDRLAGQRGFCYAAYAPVLASYCPHHGEEPVLSGLRGSGTIFFGNCNMHCVYCQNYQISQDWQQQQKNEYDITTLTERMLILQEELYCHNINLVTPSHFVPQIVKALIEAIRHGFHLPLVYNSSGYDSLDTIQALDGIIDIYLPDLRYADNKIGKLYSGVPDYVERSRAAVKEMYRQVGNLELDNEGVAQKGLIVRHLILPERLAGSAESLRWLAEELSPEVTVSIMAQYYPRHKAAEYPPLARSINAAEYREVVDLLEKLGLKNGWVQEMDAPTNYLPDFESEGHPFEKGG
ncbi:MAG: radical SAM protein [Dehalococcoidales bacterium]|nr:radical SAM protein [Dehalococcoidales bacterium]